MFNQIQNIYKRKRVFITGHTGFKGAWLIKTLSLLGADIKGYALKPKTSNDIFNYIEVDKFAETVIADIRDKQKLTKEIVSYQPDFVFHLAAQPLVRLSYEIPSETFEVNALGTAHVLDAIRVLDKKCNVVLITTDKVYHNYEWNYPYRENDRLGGYDPYSASKACAELVIDCYRNSFFNPGSFNQHGKAIAVARAGNVIGGGDWAKDRLIPDVVRAISEDKEVYIRNPFSLRPWQHVLEPIVGYLILGLKLESDPIAFSQAYNFGPDNQDNLLVEEVVKRVIEKWQRGSYKIETTNYQLHEANLLRLDISKAVTELGWKPKMNAYSAINETVSWYKEFLTNKENISMFTENQIETYFKSNN